MKAPLPANEAQRLESLRFYQILDTEPEAVYDEITQLAAYICQCPIATISVIEKDRQWYKARLGMDLKETPREISFCAHTIVGQTPLVVEDTTLDARFADNPVVKNDPHVRFYAGVPLIDKEGCALGTLCVVDRQPRQLSKEQTVALEALARHVVTHLELRRALIERRLAEEEVRRLNAELEQRVSDRTAELKAANETLQKEMAEIERLQRQMVQIQKMEAIGRLAGGIAHDFNNLLMVISGYCEILLLDQPEDSLQLENMREIQKAVRRGSSLTRQLLAFSRRQVVESKVFDLNATLDNMQGMLLRLIGADIKCDVFQAPDLPPIKADPSQIEQVIMNLVINAADAMPTGGDIVIETSALRLDRPLAYEGGELEPNDYTVLTVRDSGVGMGEEIKAHIFEPFFTTKPDGKGTGLGLATCHGITRQAGGHICCESQPGHGTTFRVYFPAWREKSAARETIRLAPPIQRGTESILLVEDDPAVRKLTSMMLQRLGYTLYEAEDGLEALAFLSSRTTLRLDLLISDVVMPKMNGRELTQALLRLRPELKCLLISGHTDDALIQHGVLNTRTHFLQKPFSPPQLARSVREALDAVLVPMEPSEAASFTPL
jgi:signal transduction histidine kinase/CheY-like chemotaxis protein